MINVKKWGLIRDADRRERIRRRQEERTLSLLARIDAELHPVDDEHLEDDGLRGDDLEFDHDLWWGDL